VLLAVFAGAKYGLAAAATGSRDGGGLASSESFIAWSNQLDCGDAGADADATGCTAADSCCAPGSTSTWLQAGHFTRLPAIDGWPCNTFPHFGQLTRIGGRSSTDGVGACVRGLVAVASPAAGT
jgi:hypothetical protein